jgi:hypothetical protein
MSQRQYPLTGSLTYYVLKSLHTEGPQGFESLKTKIPMLKRDMYRAIYRQYGLPNKDGVVSLSQKLADWFDGKPEMQEVVTGLAPMKAWVPPKVIRRVELEERSFITSGTSSPVGFHDYTR